MQIDPSKLNIGEIELLQWQYKGDLGNFKNYLWKAISNADNNHLNRLAMGFPEQVTAYRKFTGEDGYWQSVLVRSGLVQPPPTTPEESPPGKSEPGIVPPPAKDPGKPYDH